MTGTAHPGIAVAATFTSDGITAAMATSVARLAGEPSRAVVAAPYGQLVEPLLDPNSVLLTNTGVNVLLVRVEDLHGDRLLDELLTALRAAPTRGTATWLVALTPPSPRSLADPDAARWVDDATTRIADTVGTLPGVHLVPQEDLPDRYAVSETHDEYADRLAHLPYTDEFSDALADWLARLAATTWRGPRKVVVVDCDNTLWSGVCGEDGPLGVEIGAGHRRVQEFLLSQRKQGKLLCVCSRNNEADALAVFVEHPHMVISIKDVTAHRIGWRPKAEYLRELSAELRLALNSFVFVDDDAVECASVRAQLPEVAVVELARDGAEARRQLDHEPAFDQLAVTDEDRLRADWYAAEPARAALRQSAADYEEFLARCAIEVTTVALADAALERAAQLTARTTQFTLTGETYSVPRLRQVLAGGGRGWTVRVRDTFGDYGVVGLVLAEVTGEVLDVPVFLLSCRVLNRRVETRVLRFLAEQASLAGCRVVRLRHRPTARNAPAREFLEQLTSRAEGPDGAVEVAVADWVGTPEAAGTPQ
jgi:FkbH-like protein